MFFEMLPAENGYILRVKNDSQDKVYVYQNNYEDSVDCFADFLRFIDEEYGPVTGRYAQKRIYISVKPGDKYEDLKREYPDLD